VTGSRVDRSVFSFASRVSVVRIRACLQARVTMFIRIAALAAVSGHNEFVNGIPSLDRAESAPRLKPPPAPLSRFLRRRLRSRLIRTSCLRRWRPLRSKFLFSFASRSN